MADLEDTRARRALIVELVRTRHVATQGDLRDLLRAKGHDVTQATLSRDLAKLRRAPGRRCRTAARPTRSTASRRAPATSRRSSRRWRRSCSGIREGAAIVVVHTRPGAAPGGRRAARSGAARQHHRLDRRRRHDLRGAGAPGDHRDAGQDAAPAAAPRSSVAVIRLAAQDPEAAVELLEDEDADQPVRDGQPAERDQPACAAAERARRGRRRRRSRTRPGRRRRAAARRRGCRCANAWLVSGVAALVERVEVRAVGQRGEQARPRPWPRARRACSTAAAASGTRPRRRPGTPP